MQSFGSWLLLILVIITAIPVAVFCCEILAAVFLPQPPILKGTARELRPRVGVLIPAHNEGAHLRSTIENVKSQLRKTDRFLVVADNCIDDTAAVALSLGVEVIARHDALHVGKGYALDFGIRYLVSDPPEILIIVDADCVFTADSIEILATVCRAERRPVQALNLMKPPAGLSESFQLAEFAWRIKNWARPLGLRALRLPCQLTGTGMAFPWDLIQSASLASGEIVEDLKLGLDLAKAGKPALFCPSASVVSYFPNSQEGIDSQKQRWQKGHLGMIAKQAPRTLKDGIVNRDVRLLMLALDLAVPPLFFLALVELGLLLVSATAFWLGDPAPTVYVAFLANGLLVLTVALCWINFGRDVISVKTLLAAPLLIGRKLLFYRRIVFGREVARHWIRTDRSKPMPPSCQDRKLDGS